jgi:hypothetical protein
MPLCKAFHRRMLLVVLANVPFPLHQSYACF